MKVDVFLNDFSVKENNLTKLEEKMAGEECITEITKIKFTYFILEYFY